MVICPTVAPHPHGRRGELCRASAVEVRESVPRAGSSTAPRLPSTPSWLRITHGVVRSLPARRRRRRRPALPVPAPATAGVLRSSVARPRHDRRDPGVRAAPSHRSRSTVHASPGGSLGGPAADRSTDDSSRRPPSCREDRSNRDLPVTRRTLRRVLELGLPAEPPTEDQLRVSRSLARPARTSLPSEAASGHSVGVRLSVSGRRLARSGRGAPLESNSLSPEG